MFDGLDLIAKPEVITNQEVGRLMVRLCCMTLTDDARRETELELVPHLRDMAVQVGQPSRHHQPLEDDLPLVRNLVEQQRDKTKLLVARNNYSFSEGQGD